MIEFVAGAGCLSFLIALLCALHMRAAGVFLWGGLATIGLALVASQESAPAQWPPGGFSRLDSPYLLLFLAYFFIYYFVNALAPEVSPDGTGYHLGNVVRMWRNHGFVWDYHSMYSYLSQGIEMLFVMAFSFGRHGAAALVHFTYLCTLPLLMVCWGRRFGFLERVSSPPSSSSPAR